MHIQSILFPEVGRCMEEELYYRYVENTVVGPNIPWPAEIVQSQKDYELKNKELVFVDKQAKKIRFLKGGCLWFDTYFNGFSAEKWYKYTVVDNVSLILKLSGRFRVTLFSREKINDENIKYVIGESVTDASEEKEYVFSYTGANGKGMYSFKLEALEDDCVFYGGEYTSDVAAEKIRNVKIGIGICTFKRETFIEKNLKILKEAILENKESKMYGHLEVYVSDNGQTLDYDRLAMKNIHIYPNKNLGGAGGFTRDLIEMKISNDKEKLGITHALLMDDDIVIEPEALVKTYMVLSLLKDEFCDAFIGGAMLRIDRQYEQVESGASWNGGMLISNKHGLDLRNVDACLYNEIEEYTEFNAWWYCCFPMSVVRDDNLPLPIFIRGDDLEYGLRNMKDLILMNGICVWHEPFENKYSSFLEYYITRNQLIDNSFHCRWYGKKQLKREVKIHCVQEIMLYRYKNVELYLQGIKDFLKGPKWLMEQDGEALHKQVMAAGYKGQELKTLDMPFHYYIYKDNMNISDNPKALKIRALTFNGLFFRNQGDTIVPMAAANSIQSYRKKRVMFYDVTSKKAFVTERNVGASIKYMFKTIGVLFEVSLKLDKAQEAYRTEGMKLRTREFWNEFLGLN